MSLIRRASSYRIAHLHAAVALLSCAGACVESDRQPPEEAPRIVRVERVRPGPHQATVRLLGVLAASGSVPLVAPSAGVVSYPARFAAGLRTGERVKPGETIATISDVDSRVGLAEAKLEAERARVRSERSQKGFDEGVVSRERKAEDDATRALADARLSGAAERSRQRNLVSPCAGTLAVDTAAVPGSTLAAGTQLAHLLGDGPMRVDASAAAADRDVLVPGLGVALSAHGAPAGRGTLRDVGGSVELGGTIRVVVSVDDWPHAPLPGEGVELDVELPARADALTVPLQAIATGTSGSAVFVLEQAGSVATANRRPVELGRRGGDRVEVLRGLVDGATIAVSGVEFLNDGDAVVPQVKPAGASGARAVGGT